MSYRTSRRDVEDTFRFLCRAIGWTAGHEHGEYCLDYDPTYGGYVIEHIDNESYGVSRPFGSRRLPAGEICRAMHLAIMALDAKARLDHQPAVAPATYQENHHENHND